MHQLALTRALGAARNQQYCEFARILSPFLQPCHPHHIPEPRSFVLNQSRSSRVLVLPRRYQREWSGKASGGGQLKPAQVAK
jgi:hypothetical protein